MCDKNKFKEITRMMVRDPNCEYWKQEVIYSETANKISEVVDEELGGMVYGTNETIVFV